MRYPRETLVFKDVGGNIVEFIASCLGECLLGRHVYFNIGLHRYNKGLTPLTPAARDLLREIKAGMR